MTLKKIFSAAALMLTVAAPAIATPINLNFSFGSVSGTFYGLDNADGTVAASSYDLNGLLDTYVGVDTFSASDNEFTFSEGVLTDALFFHFPNRSGLAGTGLLEEFNLDDVENGVAFEDSLLVGGDQANSFGRVSFTQTSVTTIPLPASALLLLTGFAGVAALKRQRNTPRSSVPRRPPWKHAFQPDRYCPRGGGRYRCPFCS